MRRWKVWPRRYVDARGCAERGDGWLPRDADAVGCAEARDCLETQVSVAAKRRGSAGLRRGAGLCLLLPPPRGALQTLRRGIGFALTVAFGVARAWRTGCAAGAR